MAQGVIYLGMCSMDDWGGEEGNVLSVAVEWNVL